MTAVAATLRLKLLGLSMNLTQTQTPVQIPSGLAIAVESHHPQPLLAVSHTPRDALLLGSSSGNSRGAIHPPPHHLNSTPARALVPVAPVPPAVAAVVRVTFGEEVVEVWVAGGAEGMPFRM